MDHRPSRGLLGLILGVLAGVGSSGVVHAEPAPAKRPPNIVLILADDLGMECLGSYGGTSYRTPNLDALAESGLRFTRCYSNPMCSPSRVALMTGQYNCRNYRGWGVLDPRKERTFGHLLRDAGYATALAGKWQFDDFRQHPHHIKDCGFEQYCAWTWQLEGKGETARYWDPSLWRDGKLLGGTAGKYGPDIETAFLIDFIKGHKDKPFFVYFPMTLVHGPHEPTPDGGKEAKDGAGRFGDMVAYMDKMVGRVVGTLDDLKLREQTLILFTGDNGTSSKLRSTMNGEVVKGGKGRMTDAGSHVPLLASWRGVTPAGTVCDDLISFTDFLPTLAEVSGAAPPRDRVIDGRSFAPQLRDEKGQPRDWLLVELGKERFVMDQRFKLDQAGNLFDVRGVPFEENRVDPATASPDANQARERLNGVLKSLPRPWRGK